MTITDKRLAAGTLTTSNATLYTAPATTGAFVIVKSIALCNKTAVAAAVTLKLDGFCLYSVTQIAANSSIILSNLDQIINVNGLIEGLASADTAIDYMISGKEITP